MADDWDDFSTPEESWDSIGSVAEGANTEGGDELVQWAHLQVPKSRIIEVAAKRGQTPENIMRLGTPQGRLESRLAKSALGQTLLRAEQGLGDLGTAALSLANRVGISSIPTEKLHEDALHREHFLNLIEEGGDLKNTLGESGNRIYNGVVRNTGKMAAAGMGGAVALYSAIGGESFDSAMNEATQGGLEGMEAMLYAGKKTGVELGVTFMMGRAMQKLGIKTLEESLAPTTKREAGRIVEKLGLGPKITEFVKHLGGSGAEFAEESVVDGIHQYLENGEGFRDGFDIMQNLEAGATGALSAGAVSSAQAIGEALNGAQPLIDAHVEAMQDAKPLLETATMDDVADLQTLDDEELKAKVGKPDATPEYVSAIRDQINDRVAEDTEAAAVEHEVSGENALPQSATEAVQYATDATDTTTPVSEQTGDPSQTTARNADLQRDAEMLGLDSYFSPGVKQKAEMQSEARALGVPQRAMEIAQGVMKTGRDLKLVEQEGLKIRLHELKKTSVDMAKQVDEATDPTDIADKGAHLNRIDSEAQMIHDALVRQGKEDGRRLVFRKFAVDDDFSPVSLIARAKSASHAEIKPETRAELNKLATEHAKVDAELQAKDAEVRGKQAFKILEQMTNPGPDTDLSSLYKQAQDLFKGACDF